MQQKAGKYFVIRRQCVNCEGPCNQPSTWRPDSPPRREVPVKCAGTGPSTLLHGNRQGRQLLESRAWCQAQAGAVRGDTPVCYYRGRMIKSPQVPSQELDPGSTTLRLQLPRGSKGQTRSSLDLRSRGNGHLSAGTGPEGLVHERYLCYSWACAGS